MKTNKKNEMNFINIPESQILNAYKKLKHYYYYDNTTLNVRTKIAAFEMDNFPENLPIEKVPNILKGKVDKVIEEILSNDDYLQNNLDFIVLPKQILKKKIDIITNNSKESKDIEIERLNLLIDAPVEVHILSVLWVMYVGRYISDDEQYSYANKLNLEFDENDEPQQNLKLYKPYFVQYQKWRDDAINKAESLLDDNRDVTILSLDIKDYFHSIRLDFESLTKHAKNAIALKHEKENNAIGKDLQIEYSVQLNKVLNKVHKQYYLKIKKCLPSYQLDSQKVEDVFKYPLPIGLISSGLLGNYYLKSFDDIIIQELNPAFYGRYVDDLMFVFSNLNQHMQPDLLSPTLSFLYNNFVKKKILDIDFGGNVKENLLFDSKEPGELVLFETKKCLETKLSLIKNELKGRLDFVYDEDFLIQKSVEKIAFIIRSKKIYSCGNQNHRVVGADYNNLKIQSSKIVLHFFNHKESRAVLNIFKKRLEEQRSEFRFLPDEDELSDRFDEEAFSLRYNDSENKFRSIQDFSENKYGASKFLAKKIFARSFGDKEEDVETDKQILTFFKEGTALSFYALWEKVATYFVIGERTDHLIKFRRNVLFAINKIKVDNCPEIQQPNIGDTDPSHPSKINDLIGKIKKNLENFLDQAIVVALALNPNLEFGFLNSIEEASIKKNREDSKILRNSNLFRTTLMAVPGINYTSYLRGDGSLLRNNFGSYFRDSISVIVESGNGNKDPNIDPLLAFLAPNYVPFHEVNILKIVETISNLDDKTIIDGMKKADSTNSFISDEVNNIPERAFEDYYRINYSWKRSFINSNKKNSIKSKYFSMQEIRDSSGKLRYINIDVIGDKSANIDEEKVDKRVGLVNIKVEESNWKRSVLEKPNLSRARRKSIFRLLNEADRLESDIIVFPEISTPYSWLRLLAERSHKRHLGIVAGLEHWINNKGIAFNFMVTILPFKVNDYTTSLIKIRLKNHYSPAEKEFLKGYRLIVPEDAAKEYIMSYDLFHWKKTYFSVYNCFELADISHRSLFKSKVDFIVASEFNKDTTYFSDIAGAWVRDVHTYFIQVNSSQFGDSRLIQPAKSFQKDLIQVKGGINSTVLVGNLEIKKLRDFQLVEYNLQHEFTSSGRYDFKPTPPDFSRVNVKNRINNAMLIINN